jgi:hypothetical protein
MRAAREFGPNAAHAPTRCQSFAISHLSYAWHRPRGSARQEWRNGSFE